MPTRRTTPPALATAGPPGAGRAPAAVVAPEDSLSRASTIVIGGNQRTVVASPPRRRPRRIVWLAAGCALLLVLVAVTAILLFRGGSGTRQAAAYDYSFQYPDDWRQTSGNPQLWQTLVSPETAAPGTDVIAVQEGRLNYDAGAHRDQAVRDLRAEYDAKVAAGGHFSDFNGSATYGGKTVVSYQEQLPQATADWFIVHQEQFQVSVGCQYTPQGQQDVQRTCERLVRSLTVRGR